MCKPQTCPTCSKSSWFGCGLHVPRVMDVIPEAERCQCAPKFAVGDKQYPPKAGTAKEDKHVNIEYDS